LVEYFRSPTIIIPTRETFSVSAAQPCCTSPGPMRHAGSRIPRLLLPRVSVPRVYALSAYVVLKSGACRVVPVLSPAHPHVIHWLSQLQGAFSARVPTRFTVLMSYTLRSTGTMQVPMCFLASSLSCPFGCRLSKVVRFSLTKRCAKASVDRLYPLRAQGFRR
jgi:hypothetical protein